MPAFAASRRLVSVLLLFLVVDVLASSTVGQETSQELLIGRLKQTQVAPKVSAARRLAEQGTLAAQAAPALIECLSDPSADVRVVAAFALAKVSTDRSASIAAMQSLLSDASEHVRYSAQWSTAQLASQLPLDLVEPELSETILMLDKSLELLRSHEHQPRHRAALESVIELLRSRVAQSAPPKLVAPERSATEPVLAKPVPEDKTNSASPSVDAADLVQGLYEPNDAISRMQTIRRLRDPQRFPTEIRQNVLKFEATQLDYVLLDYAIALWGKSVQSDMSSLLDDIAIDGVLPDYAYQFIERLQATDQETVMKLQGWSQDSRQPQEVRAAAIKAISLSQHDRQGCIHWIASLLADTDLQMDAAYALSELGEEASSAEPQLIAALRASTDESFQIAGVIALAKIAGDSTTAAQFVNQWLAATPTDSPFLPFLLDSSGQFSKVADSVIPLLRQNLLNANIDARLAAVKALQQFGERAEAALPELMRVLTSPSEEAFIQSAAARAVGAIGPATSEQLLHAIVSAEPAAKINLLRTLALSGINSMEAQAVCLDLLNNAAATTELRVAAANTLGAMGRAARPAVAQILLHCNANEDLSVHAMCLLAAAQIDPAVAKPNVELGLKHDSTLVRTNAAFAMHLCGESRLAFDSLLSMLCESETDFVIKQALRELGSPIAPWLHEQAEDYQLDDVQRLACCELACELDQPDWSRLLKLVEDPNLGQQFANQLSYHWHPEIACNIAKHLPEVETLLELTQSSKISVVGRARLASLLSPDGLGAGDDEENWGGLALSQPASIEMLQRADDSYRIAAAMSDESPSSASNSAPASPGAIPNKIVDRESDFVEAIETAQKADSARLQHVEPRQDTAEPPLRKVDVFYGTNRQREAISTTMKQVVAAILAVTIGSTIAMAYCAVSFFGRGRRVLSLASVFALAVFGSFGIFAAKQLALNPLEARVAYNHRMAGSIEYGKCVVSIPPNHQPGVVESPVLWKAELILDPSKHVVLEQVKQLSQEDFLDSIKQTQSRKGKNLLVFIHGYNVSFEDAAKRTAQMAFDLDFPGAPIFYSWPSQADWYGYKTDKRQIELSVDHIKNFLEELAHRSGAETINLVAHSMGNVGLTAALQEISSPKDRPLFNQVVLAAPDVDAEVFKRDIAPNIVSKANRMTLYTSKTDLALIASRFFNKGLRLGDSGPEIVTFPGIETIDATTVDSSLLGHSYYGSNISVLTDVGQLLRNEPITGRSYLRRIDVGDAGYWTFDPVLISRTQSLFDGMMKK